MVQEVILAYLKKKRGWVSTREVLRELEVGRTNIAGKFRKLERFGFIETKTLKNGVGMLYGRYKKSIKSLSSE
ncbi:MAG: hypothetical protein Q7R52_02415 [archaeon]|nr:hypothetical protein [archaeon]